MQKYAKKSEIQNLMHKIGFIKLTCNGINIRASIVL